MYVYICNVHKYPEAPRSVCVCVFAHIYTLPLSVARSLLPCPGLNEQQLSCPWIKSVNVQTTYIYTIGPYICTELNLKVLGKLSSNLDLQLVTSGIK